MGRDVFTCTQSFYPGLAFRHNLWRMTGQTLQSLLCPLLRWISTVLCVANVYVEVPRSRFCEQFKTGSWWLALWTSLNTKRSRHDLTLGNAVKSHLIAFCVIDSLAGCRTGRSETLLSLVESLRIAFPAASGNTDSPSCSMVLSLSASMLPIYGIYDFSASVDWARNSWVRQDNMQC